MKFEVYNDGLNMWVVSTHSIRYEKIKELKELVYSSETKYGSLSQFIWRRIKN